MKKSLKQIKLYLARRRAYYEIYKIKNKTHAEEISQLIKSAHEKLIENNFFETLHFGNLKKEFEDYKNYPWPHNYFLCAEEIIIYSNEAKKTSSLTTATIVPYYANFIAGAAAGALPGIAPKSIKEAIQQCGYRFCAYALGYGDIIKGVSSDYDMNVKLGKENFIGGKRSLDYFGLVERIIAEAQDNHAKEYDALKKFTNSRGLNYYDMGWSELECKRRKDLKLV